MTIKNKNLKYLHDLLLGIKLVLVPLLAFAGLLFSPKISSRSSLFVLARKWEHFFKCWMIRSVLFGNQVLRPSSSPSSSIHDLQ